MTVNSEKECHLLPSSQQSVSLSSPSFWNKGTLAMLLFASLCLTWPLFTLTAGRSSVSTRQDDQKVMEAYTAPLAFPTSAFSSYYSSPSGTLYEPRPAITDYAAGHAFPPSLDQPYPLPTGPPSSEAVYPEAIKSAAPRNNSSQIESNINSIITNTSLTSCQKCVRSMQQGQLLAQANPKSIPGVLINLCTRYKFTSTVSGLNQSEVCKRTYSGATLGAQYTQILSYIDLKQGDDSRDALFLCNLLVSKSNCSKPAPLDLNADGFLDNWFGGKQKREEMRQHEMTKRSTASGPTHLKKRGKKKMLKVLHVSWNGKKNVANREGLQCSPFSLYSSVIFTSIQGL